MVCACAGTEIVHGNTNANYVTELDHPWGTFRYVLDAFAPESGFEGTWHVTRGYIFDEVGKGYGKLEGWQLRASWEWNPASSGEPGDLTTPYGWLSGYVFNPGG